MAEKSIKHIVGLVAQLYPSLQHSSVPAYQFVPFDSVVGRDLCYRAMMHNDHHAQYLVAMSLKAQALMAQDQTSTQAVAPDETHKLQMNQGEVPRLFAQAAYWFALAAPFEHAALYEHGVSLLHGYADTAKKGDSVPKGQYKKEGELLIAQAAKHGIVEAQALLGYFYLVGSEAFSADVEQAKLLLTQAAEADNVEAMSNLGVLFYESGEYHDAYMWMSKAAESGYPQAQYHLALLLVEGLSLSVADNTDVQLEKSQIWMQEAASQGQLDAMLHCATTILHHEHATKAELEQAECYLHDVIKYGHNVTAMIELSVALADGMLGRIDVVQSAYLLQQAKLHGNDIQRQVVAPLRQSLLMQIDSVIGNYKVTALQPSEDELAALQQAKYMLR
ncbi:tetratricopeptide repeat protein [Shewanella sp. OMA3-2]|uniref:tetratricopeptide repeat protein n=1 Tax=Shewanella sp. OMA3-2 TaxID=2908650 RepID=UPI001F2A70E2|nr:tetratricopeptide repeat protein [Shewanella sp. OMA3-2]UJF22425.1 sel1 repeat family protein [Shewanella sp. OMA3-2]